jgi:hypothetical protein
MVNGTLLNFGKRYEDNLTIIFDQLPKWHLSLDSLSNQQILKGVYFSTTLMMMVVMSLSGSTFFNTGQQPWIILESDRNF